MDTLSLIVPFFAVILIGYLAARGRILPMESIPGLNVFVLYFALPAMLFQFGASTPVATLLDPTLIGLWLVSGLLVLGLAVGTGLRQRRGWLDAAFGGLIAVLPNSGFMGLPLIIALRGEQASAPITTTLLVDIVIMQSVALALSQQGQPGYAPARVRTTIKRVVSNPLPWAIVLGALWGTTDWSLFGPVDDLLTLLASAATPVALFTIGAVLARKSAGTGAENKSSVLDISWLTALKILIHPALVLALGALATHLGLPLSPADLAVLVLVAALPSAANAAMLAERLGAQSSRIAAVILLSTVLGFATFSGVAMLV